MTLLKAAILLCVLAAAEAQTTTPPPTTTFVCPTTSEWLDAMDKGDKGALDKIVDSVCGGSTNSQNYNKIARGGSPTCTKFCATCEASSINCVDDREMGGTKIYNVYACNDKATICRVTGGAASTECKSHGGNDNAGSSNCPNIDGAMHISPSLVLTSLLCVLSWAAAAAMH